MATLEDEAIRQTKSIWVGLTMTTLAKVKMPLAKNMMSTMLTKRLKRGQSKDTSLLMHVKHETLRFS
jgi:hypothetical protein